MSVALAPAVALAPVVAEGRPYLLAQAAGCLAWPATALAMVATELPRAPRVYKEMALEWPLQVKLLSKPANVLQHKRN